MQEQKDSERQPLTKGEINQTNNQTEELDQQIRERRKKYIKWGIIGSIVVVILVLIIVLPIVLTRGKDNPPGPGPGPTDRPIPPGVNPYKIDEASIVNDEISISGQLTIPTESVESLLSSQKLREDSQKLGIDWQTLPLSANNQISRTLNFSIDMLAYQVARFTLTDGDKQRYSIPDTLVKKPQSSIDMRLEMLGIDFSANPFYFSFSDVTDRSNVYVTTKDQSLIFMDKFIQMDLLLPSQKVYGLGERVHEFQLGEGTWTMWASGQDSPYDDGRGRKGLYGVHPFVLVQSGKSKDDYFGIFFRNSNAQSPVLSYQDNGKAVLSYITIGGQLEVYFILHGSAKSVIQQYQQMFGTPQLPPFWSLGWQQASWKYENISMVQEVLDNYKSNDLPLETIYFDIPYMKDYADFTVDEEKFPGLVKFTNDLHENGQRLVVIVDAAISADNTTDKYYKLGNDSGIFIKSSIAKPGQEGRNPDYGDNLISNVWPKKAVFVDWLHPASKDFWETGLNDLALLVNYDGLWLDMSEPTTFNNGEADTGLKASSEKVKRFLESQSVDNSWYTSSTSNNPADTYNLPFIVKGSDPNSGNWDNMTISLNATHPGWNNEIEYNLHSLYGHMMAWRTNEYLTGKSDNRPFILTRSTFASGGRFTSHWLGDNWRDWKYLRYSVAGIMNMNMFGIPHVGADVCGFFGENRDDEMCLRWIQLSTFYPLARAHQNLTWKGNDSERSEPYYMAKEYLDQARESLYDRYSYLRLLYTCMFEATQNGGTCFDPLFFHYPNDQEAYNNVEDTFIFANSIKAAPILDAMGNETTYESYFPQGKWINLIDFTDVIDAKEGGKFKLTPRSRANAYLKQGSLIPHQNVAGYHIKTTTQLLKNPINIVVNRDSNGFAQGSLLLDQGISRSEIKDNNYEYYQIRHQVNSIQFRLANGKLNTQNHKLGSIFILDAADLKDVDLVCAIGQDNEPLDLTFAPPTMKDGALRIDPNQQVSFNKIKTIFYGSSQDQNYLNFCNPSTYRYVLADGQNVDLNTTETSFELKHMAGVLQNIKMTLKVFDQGIINARWTWAGDKTPDGKRTPVDVPQDIIDTSARSAQTYNLSRFISYTNDQVQGFQVNFKASNYYDPLPLLTLKGMLFDSFMNQIEVELNTPKAENFTGIFGLGERANKNFFYQDGVYTSYAKDQGTPDEDGKPPSKGMYGVHPFYVFKHNTNSWAGVFTKVAQAQDWWIKNNKDAGKINVKSIAIGGIADVYVFTEKQNPESIIAAYYSIIGKPVLIPQWTLGWNQCKWGYRSASEINETVNQYAQNNLPLDVQWTDIDYMDSYRDFTYDQKAFKELPDVIKNIHDKNMKFVPIIDAGVSYRPNQGYDAYDQGAQDDVFLKVNNEYFIGKVWPNEAVFPDFFNPKTAPWWKKQLSSMHGKIEFDGLWLDMNEIANFCDGPCVERQRVQNAIQNQLPYIPGGINLETHTPSLDVTHQNGYQQVDTHSYWGTQEVKTTHDWFTENNMRTFIIERSSFAGMGKFGSRWLGDNYSDQNQMGYSVSGIMLMNMFGIPLAGGDICGFGGNTNAELCARWHVVGSYYPFSRNHNALGSKPQEPWQFPEEYEPGKTYLDIMRDAIRRKYTLVRYYYTQLFMMSQEGQKPFFKPLFFAFPEDKNAYNDIIYNVMLGDSLKLSINSDKVEQNTTTFYMPAGTWCDLFNDGNKCFNTSGETFNWPSKAYDSYVHLRQGSIVPLQDVPTAMNTADLQKEPVDFHILGEVTDESTGAWSANGIYINDDGVNLNLEGNFNAYAISAQASYVGASKTEKITIKVFLNNMATNFQSKDDENCYEVNKNDRLGKFYIYVAGRRQNVPSYTVTIYGPDGAQKSTGTATYDSKTDRIVFAPQDSLCLYSNFRFVFTPAA